MLIASAKPVRATGTSRSVSAVLYFVAVQVVHFHFDLVADPTKFISNGFRRAFRTCRVVEIAVYQVAYFSCESRTVFFRISAAIQTAASDRTAVMPLQSRFFSLWITLCKIKDHVSVFQTFILPFSQTLQNTCGTCACFAIACDIL